MPIVMSNILQDQIVAEASDPNQTVAPVLEALWATYAPIAQGSPALLFQYVRRAALNIRLAEEHDDTDIQVGGDVQDKQSQIFANLALLHDQCEAEIIRLSGVLGASRPPVTGALSKTRLSQPPFPFAPDANDSIYSGDPYRRWGTRRL